METSRTFFSFYTRKKPQILIILTWVMALSRLSFYCIQLLVAPLRAMYAA